jgi:predicted nuclease of predicted toxin-antitoxin system
MRFLVFDHNLSPKLVDRLNDLYPSSTHVDYVGLGTATDAEVWSFAHVNDLMIVTKDADFSELIVLRGFPPKVIWIRRGNCSTQDSGLGFAQRSAPMPEQRGVLCPD